MSSKRVFFIMVGATSLSLVLLVAGAVMGDIILKKQADKLMSLKVDNRAVDEQQTMLLRANKDIEKYTELQKIAKTIVPQDKDQARTVREIVNLAAENGIPIASVAFPSSNLGQSSPAAGTGASGSTTTPAPGAAISNAITQVKPVVGISGLYQMEITVQSDPNNPIPYSSLITFLSKLEQNRRTAQVGTINIIPNTKDNNLVTFNLGINVYIKP